MILNVNVHNENHWVIESLHDVNASCVLCNGSVTPYTITHRGKVYTPKSKLQRRYLLKIVLKKVYPRNAFT